MKTSRLWWQMIIGQTRLENPKMKKTLDKNVKYKL